MAGILVGDDAELQGPRLRPKTGLLSPSAGGGHVRVGQHRQGARRHRRIAESSRPRPPGVLLQRDTDHPPAPHPTALPGTLDPDPDPGAGAEAGVVAAARPDATNATDRITNPAVGGTGLETLHQKPRALAANVAAIVVVVARRPARHLGRGLGHAVRLGEGETLLRCHRVHDGGALPPLLVIAHEGSR